MSTDYAALKTKREELKTLLDLLRPDGAGGFTVSDKIKSVFEEAYKQSPGSNETLYLFGQLDVDRMAAIVKSGAMPWWPVFNARIHVADLAGMNKVFAMAGNSAAESKIDLNSSLTWSLDHYALGEINAAHDVRAVRLLLDWGADPNHTNGKWLEISLRKNDSATIQLMIERGGSPVTVFRVMDDLLKDKNYEQAARIQEALAKNTLYMKIDDETLLESKFIPAPDGGANFKALFNFRSRRVNEIYETQGADKRMTMTSVAFDDYDSAAIGFAKEKLEKLGGKPPDPLGKAQLAKPVLGVSR